MMRHDSKEVDDDKHITFYHPVHCALYLSTGIVDFYQKSFFGPTISTIHVRFRFCLVEDLNFQRCFELLENIIGDTSAAVKLSQVCVASKWWSLSARLTPAGRFAHSISSVQRWYRKSTPLTDSVIYN